MSEVNFIATLNRNEGHRRTNPSLVIYFIEDLCGKAVDPKTVALAEEQKPIVEAFLLAVVQNIDWYRKKLRRDRARAACYIALSLLVLALLPVALYFMPSWGQHGSDVVVAQVSSFLTGFFALFKMLGTLMSQNMRIGRFWKAQADLSEIYYSFRAKWLGRAFSASGIAAPAMLDDMDKAVTKARKIVHDEQSDFFTSLTLPTVDLASLLGSAQTQAANLISQAKSPTLSRMVNSEKARVLQNECELLEQEIASRLALLDETKGTAKKTSITQALTALNQQLNEKRNALIAAQATIS
jgi:hypothetical protein